MAPKNKKVEKMSLGDFLGDQSLGSWADEMEDAPMPRTGGYGGASYGGSSERPSYGGSSAFGASRTDSFAERGFATREELPLPSKPPYTAHLGNLSFDATEGDVNDFFGDCEVTNVRIVEDKLDRKPKGFGYVEFGSVDGLKKALALSGSQFQGRNVRVSVAEPPKDRPEARDISDWSRKGPLPDLPGQRPAAGRGYSSRGGFGDSGSDAGGERRRPAFESDGKPRDFGNWERRGPLSPSAEAPREGRRFDGPREPREGGYRERSSPAWGEGRPEGAPRREFQPVEGRPQVERQPTAADQDSQWRSKMRPDAASPGDTPDASTPSSPAPLASRPKLNLAKRTVSEAPAASTAAPSDKPNPFGAARPIDTAAREREVEEKQKQAVQQKKEADEKAREEKKAKEAAAKEAAAAKPAEESQAEEAPKTVENPEAEAKDEGANGEIVEDKAVKPQEPVVAPKEGGSWRRKSSTPGAGAAAPASTTEKLDEDGWSTVTKAPKNARGNRRGGGPSRAIAS